MHAEESACGLAKQSRTCKRKVVSLSPVIINIFVSLGKILNLACIVDPSDIWVAVRGCHNLMSDRLCTPLVAT